MGKEDNYICPVCGGDVQIGQCTVCGWLIAWRVEASARANTGRRGGPRGRRRTKQQIDSPYMTTTPAPMKCPVCGGRGWTTNSCDSCYLCLGHGTISGMTYQQLKRDG